MATRRQDIDKMLQSLAQDASNDIAWAIEDVANEFITSGGCGSSHMLMANSEKVTEIFRSTADVMAMQARRCAVGSGGVVRDLVDTHLSYLIDQTIKRRTKHMETGKTASQDTEILCANLLQDLKRLRCNANRPQGGAVTLQNVYLYSFTKGPQAIRDITRAMIDHTGNLPLFPGVFPDYSAPIVRNDAEGRELTLARWGMPSPVFALKGRNSDTGVTNVRNVASPHWRRWLGMEKRCVVPFTSFSENETLPDGRKPPV